MAAEDLIFTLAVLMGTGTVFYHNLSKLNIPYTVLMFIYGMVVGAFGFVLPDEYAGYFDLLADIPPKLIFHIFLPILIFEGSYGMKIHAFRQVFWQVIVLAYPGLIINMLIVAVPLKLIMFPDWNWYCALLLGSLLSATDPVAVVALLKDLGVDKRITAMVDGEAIMNDGTAIIAFTLFFPAAAVGFIEGSWDQVLIQSLQLTLGAVVFGVVCGWIQVFCLRRATDPLVITCISISMAYISFFVADVFLETSGVLTLCFQGVYLSYNYPSLFPGREGSMLNNTWHFLVHAGNTMLFALVGIIIVRDALSDFTLLDVAYIILLYITLVFARGFMITLFLPVLNQFSFKLGFRDVGLLVHGGLRGGVAMTLALIVARDDKISRAIGIDFIELTMGIVVITIVVNATTSGWVMEKLGHKAKEMNRLVQMEIGHKFVLNEADRALRVAKTTSFFRSANFNMIAALTKEIGNPYDGMRCIREGEERIFHTLLMRAFKTKIWQLRDNNQITEEVVRVLALVVADNLRKGTLITTEQLRPFMQYPWIVGRLERIGGPLAAQAQKIRQSCDEEFYGFLVAYNSALDGVEAVLSVYVTTQQQLAVAHQWLSQERDAIEHKIALFAEDKPQAATAVITKIAAGAVFQMVHEAAEELHEKKGFALPAAEALEHAIEHCAELTHGWPSELAPLSKEQLIEGSALGSGMPTGTVHAVMGLARLEQFRDDEEVRLGAAIAIVQEGVVRVLGRDDRELGSGAVFNVDRMVLSKLNATRFFAASPLKLLVVPFDALRKSADQDALLSERLLQLAAVEALEPLFARQPAFATWKYDHIVDMIEVGRIVRAPAEGYKFPIAAGEKLCFLTGADTTGLVTAGTPPFIVPASVEITWSANAVLYVVPPRFSEDVFSDPARRRAMSEMITSANDTEMLSVTSGDFSTGDASTLRQVLSSRFNNINASGSALSINYVPVRCATPVPLFNQLQIEFVAQLEALAAAAQQYISYRETPSRVALVKAIDAALQFLSRFCVQHFGAEALLYEGLGLPGWDAHRAEHDAFHAQVSVWTQKKLFADLCHDEIIAGMTAFVAHFERDARESRAVAAAWPGVASVNTQLDLPTALQMREIRDGARRE